MVTHEPDHEAHSELRRALQRSARRRLNSSPHLCDLAKFVAVICIGGGLSLERVVPALLLTGFGAVALWLCISHDDSVVETHVAARLDALTGLPTTQELETVFGDDVVSLSITGRIGVVVVDVGSITADDPDPADARMLAAAIAGRLSGAEWTGSDGGAFAPFVFVERPGRFLVILRDVIDDPTTRWLVDRLLATVNEPVSAVSGPLAPRATLAVGVGNAEDWRALVADASVAADLGLPPMIDLDTVPGRPGSTQAELHIAPGQSACMAQAATPRVR